MEFYTAIKKKVIIHGKMDTIGDYLVKQLSQTQKGSYQMLPLIVDPDQYMGHGSGIKTLWEERSLDGCRESLKAYCKGRIWSNLMYDMHI